MANIYERSLSTIIAQGKFRDSFDPRSQTRSGEESTWKGDRLEITRVVDCFFFYNTQPHNQQYHNMLMIPPFCCRTMIRLLMPLKFLKSTKKHQEPNLTCKNVKAYGSAPTDTGRTHLPTSTGLINIYQTSYSEFTLETLTAQRKMLNTKYIN